MVQRPDHWARSVARGAADGPTRTRRPAPTSRRTGGWTRVSMVARRRTTTEQDERRLLDGRSRPGSPRESGRRRARPSTGVTSVPRCPTVPSITSPDFRYVPLASPTPSRVPEAMTSPGSIVMKREANAMSSAQLKIMSPVEPCCRTDPFTLSVISRLYGSGTSSAVVIHGPHGAWPSGHLPSSQSKNGAASRSGRSPVHRPRADVVDDRIARDVVERALDRDVLRPSADDDRELELPVDRRRDVGVRQLERLARGDDRGARLDEQLRDDLVLVDGRATALHDVLLEVAGNRQELPRPRHRGEELHRSDGRPTRRRRGDAAGLGDCVGSPLDGGCGSASSRPPDASARSTMTSEPPRLTTAAARAVPSAPR